MNVAEWCAATEQLLGGLKAHATSGELRRAASGTRDEALYFMHLTWLDHLAVWVAWCKHGTVSHTARRRLVHVGSTLDQAIEAAERRLDSKLGRSSGRYHCHAGHARFTSSQIQHLRTRAA